MRPRVSCIVAGLRPPDVAAGGFGVTASAGRDGDGGRIEAVRPKRFERSPPRVSTPGNYARAFAGAPDVHRSRWRDRPGEATSGDVRIRSESRFGIAASVESRASSERPV